MIEVIGEVGSKVVLVRAVIGAVVALFIALYKNRSPGWAVLGFLFPITAVFAVACLPEAESEEAEAETKHVSVFAEANAITSAAKQQRGVA